MDYVRVRQGDGTFWLAKGVLKSALKGHFEVLEKKGSDLVGWRYTGPYDALPAVTKAFGHDARRATSIGSCPWNEVGEDEGTGIVHIAPGAGAEDYQLGKSLGLPMIGPIDETAATTPGSAGYRAAAPDVAEEIVDDLERAGSSTTSSRTRTAIRTAGAAARRCSSGSSTSGSSRWARSTTSRASELTTEEIDASLRYQIMEVVDQIRWIPGFGYERELDWLLNMHDWMICKKRYWGLALPIYDCPHCGTFDVIGGRDELKARAVDGWDKFEGHTPHRPYVDFVTIACPAAASRSSASRTSATLAGRRDRAVLDAPLPRGPRVLGEVVPGRLHHRELPGPVPQLVLRDAGDVDRAAARAAVQDDLRLRHAVRRGRPGDAQELGQLDRVRRGGRADGRRRHALDVRRRPTRGQHPLRLARRGRGAPRAARAVERLCLLRDLCAPGRLVARRGAAPRTGPTHGARSLDPFASRGDGRGVGADLADYDARAATRTLRTFIDDLSTWYLRRSRGRMRAGAEPADRDAAFSTLHAVLVTLARTARADPAVPGRRHVPNLVHERCRTSRTASTSPRGPRPRWRPQRDLELEATMEVARRAVDLARTLRPRPASDVRQPLARMWLALPSALGTARLFDLIADEVNVKDIERIDDESELVDRRVKPLLPKIGKQLGSRSRRSWPRPAPARRVQGRVGDARRRDARRRRGRDPGHAAARHAVAHDEGLVVVIDTELTPELRAEGDARELQRAVQDLRKDADLDLDARIELWIDGVSAAVEPFLRWWRARRSRSRRARAPRHDAKTATVELTDGPATIGLRPAA